MIVCIDQPSEADLFALEGRGQIEKAMAESAVSEVVDFKNCWVKKPWGRESLFFENDDVAIWLLEIDAYAKTSMHCHPNKNTSLLVLGGQAECVSLDGRYQFTQGQGIYLGKKVFHQTKNQSDQKLYVLEIESPVNKFDLVRLEDDYGRKNDGYEGKSQYYPEQHLTLTISHGEVIERQIGDSILALGYSEKLEDLTLTEHDVITILNRHIWSEAGQKIFEVGRSFKNEDLATNYALNQGFVYLTLKRGNSIEDKE